MSAYANATLVTPLGRRGRFIPEPGPSSYVNEPYPQQFLREPPPPVTSLYPSFDDLRKAERAAQRKKVQDAVDLLQAALPSVEQDAIRAARETAKVSGTESQSPLFGGPPILGPEFLFMEPVEIEAEYWKRKKASDEANTKLQWLTNRIAELKQQLAQTPQ